MKFPASPDRINDRLTAKLDYWTKKIPSKIDFIDQYLPGQGDTLLPTGGMAGDHRSPIDTSTIFGIESYEAILYGMEFLSAECDQWFGQNRPATRVPKYVIDRLTEAPRTLPPHDAWLQRVANMQKYTVSAAARR